MREVRFKNYVQQVMHSDGLSTLGLKGRMNCESGFWCNNLGTTRILANHSHSLYGQYLFLLLLVTPTVMYKRHFGLWPNVRPSFMYDLLVIGLYCLGKTQYQ